jgi:hypothetical protein
MERRPASRSILIDIALMALILLGVVFRFTNLTWHQGTNLHPDEYGLTNTLIQISLPRTLEEYFNTRLSPLSPYHKYDLQGRLLAQGPDNRMRWGQWPITILRWFGEKTGQTGYDEMRVLGRSLSATADSLALLLLVAAGTRLYGRRVGLLAGALSALAVMQIQQSHFMTVDNFAVLFTMLALLAAVMISGVRPAGAEDAQEGQQLPWYLLFGVSFGMAMAARINLLPLAGLAVAAAFVRQVRYQNHLPAVQSRQAVRALIYLGLAGLVSLAAFRLTQPMSFRAETGDTTWWTIQLNPDWRDSMRVAQAESQGQYPSPPAEQWAHRPAIVFPWLNMVLWGMGLPLGLAAWGGFAWAAWRSLRLRPGWHAHLLPLLWTGGYFLFMGTRWVKSVRYFLPIYPFLCLLAAWALVELFRRQRLRAEEHTRKPAIPVLPALIAGIVVLGTLAWASAFVRAVYLQEHTRLQATRWIWENIPAVFTLHVEEGNARQVIQVHTPDRRTITSQNPWTSEIRLGAGGQLESVEISYARAIRGQDGFAPLRISISTDPGGQQTVANTTIQVPVAAPGEYSERLRADFSSVSLQPGQRYYLTARVPPGSWVALRQAVIANESWDETLPVPLEGRYLFGPAYQGVIMEVRWFDSEEKRHMLLANLEQVDTIILPSQRAIWSASRIPLTYPMTMEYYRALFDGRLGFELVAHFSSPLEFGPLKISDVGGRLAWGEAPELPLFNYNPFAAEEAFSVYDHPPVWIFKKRADFDPQAARQVLETVDLTQVVIQSPRDADWNGWLAPRP